jgi:hypothetical protein
MILFDLSDDILEIVVDEVFRLRKNACIRELVGLWRKRSPYGRLRLSGGRVLHEGRAFLSKSDNLKTLSLVKFMSKYFICGIPAFSISDYNYNTRVTKYGMSFKVVTANGNVSVVGGKIINMGLNNGWEDFKDQTDDTIVRYLMDKEQERKYY